jgi:hypothetical protein
VEDFDGDQPLCHGVFRWKEKYPRAGRGRKWENLTVVGLKAFMAIHMYMGMKKQPNYKSYWEREGGFFHCPIISNIINSERFRELCRCLHLTNPATYEYIHKR